MKLKLRAVIKFCIKQKKNHVETMKLIHSTYGEASMSQTTVYKWYNTFENGRTSIKDNNRNGPPKEATKEGKVDAVRNTLEKSRRVTVRMIADELNISEGNVHKILTKDLCKKKVCTWFVPHFLTSKSSAHCCFERFDWNGRKRWGFFRFDCYGWWELVLRVQSLKKTSIMGLAESKSEETSKSTKCEIKNQDDAYCFFFRFKRYYLSWIRSLRQDGEWWVLQSSYEAFNLPDSSYEINIDQKG